MLAAPWFLARTATDRAATQSAGFAAAAICATLASFSPIQGLAVWLAGAAFLYVSAGGGRSALRDRPLWAWIGPTFVVVALHGWVTALTPTLHSSPKNILASAPEPLGLGPIFLAMMSTVWGDRLGEGAIYAGTSVDFPCGAGPVAAIWSRQIARHALPLALILFGFAFASMVTVGRLHFAVAAALESRCSGCVPLVVAGSLVVLLSSTKVMSSERAKLRGR